MQAAWLENQWETQVPSLVGRHAGSGEGTEQAKAAWSLVPPGPVHPPASS